MHDTIRSAQDKIDQTFFETFGSTPLRERFNDITQQWTDLIRYRDMENLKDELGDLITASMQLASEMSWDVESLIKETLTKIQGRKEQYETFGRQKRVAILRGDFYEMKDYMLAISKLVLRSCKFIDEIWVMPTFYSGSVYSTLERLRTIEAELLDHPLINISSFEIKRELNCTQYECVKKLFERYKEVEFYFIIKNTQIEEVITSERDLTAFMRFIVVDLYNNDNQDKWFLHHPHKYIRYEGDELDEY